MCNARGIGFSVNDVATTTVSMHAPARVVQVLMIKACACRKGVQLQLLTGSMPLQAVLRVSGRSACVAAQQRAVSQRLSDTCCRARE